MISFILNYLLNWYYAIFVISDSLINNTTYCVFGIFSAKAVGDICRSLSFIATLYFVTINSSQMFPLPFTWIFRDLSKFIFEPMCVKVFRDYLKAKEKSKSEFLDEIMTIYLNPKDYKNKSIIAPSSVGTGGVDITNESTTRQLFMEYINQLQPSFMRFKQTVAYKALYLRVKEFEAISEKAYQ